MAQTPPKKCLPYKREDLSLIPKTHIKKEKLSVVTHTCNPRMGEVETGLSLEEEGHPWDSSDSRPS